MLFAVVAVLCACRPVKQFYREDERTVKVVRDILRDTVVVTEQDSSWVKVLLECDSTGRVLMKELLDYRAGKRVRLPQLEVRDNILTSVVRIDSSAVYLAWRERYEADSVAVEREIVRVVEVNRLKGWQKVLIGIGALWLILFALRMWKRFKV